APLATVLQDLSKQKNEMPYWRFEVFDREAVKKRVTVTIPEDSTLRDALDIVLGSVDCSYDWCWHSPYGGRPNCALFLVYKNGTKFDAASNFKLFVEGSTVIQNE